MSACPEPDVEPNVDQHRRVHETAECIACGSKFDPGEGKYRGLIDAFCGLCAIDAMDAVEQVEAELI